MVPQQVRIELDDYSYPLLFVTIAGPHLYGFPSSNTPYNLHGTHVLPLRELVGLELGPEQLEHAVLRGGVELRISTNDIKPFFGLLLRRNGSTLEQLYSPLVARTTVEHRELKHITRSCITRYHSHHYIGVAETQWRVFTKEHVHSVLPLLEVFRALLTGIHLMRTGEIEADLLRLNETFGLSYLPELVGQQREDDKAMLGATNDVQFYQQEYDRLQNALEQAFHATSLPDAPTGRAALHDLLLRLRLPS